MKRFLSLWENSASIDRKLGAKAWYWYRSVLTELADKHGVMPKQAFGVFAALSPNNGYLSNMRDCANVLEAFRKGKPRLELVPVHTFHANRKKAVRIVTGEHPLQVLSGNKVTSFYRNIADPEDPNYVTVDGHIFNAYRNERVSLKMRAASVSDRNYHEVSSALKEAAKELGVIPNVLQATVWHYWRRIHAPSDLEQFEFWHQGMLAADLGYFVPVSPEMSLL